MHWNNYAKFSHTTNECKKRVGTWRGDKRTRCLTSFEQADIGASGLNKKIVKVVVFTCIAQRNKWKSSSTCIYQQYYTSACQNECEAKRLWRVNSPSHLFCVVQMPHPPHLHNVPLLANVPGKDGGRLRGKSWVIQLCDFLSCLQYLQTHTHTHNHGASFLQEET